MKERWNWSWAEMGLYDAPAFIEKMLEENKTILQVFHDEQERQFFNPHLYNVTQEQWHIYGNYS